MAKRTIDVKVAGIKTLMKALKQLPVKSQRRVVKSAVSKASTPIVKMAKKLTPLGDGLKPDGTKREHLRKTITKTAAKVYKNGAVVVTIGPKAKAAPHAHLVDLGTKPHDIVLSKPWGRVPAGTTIKHPGAKPSNFLKRAVEATRQQAKAAMEKGIAKGIEREAAKLASGK